MSDWPKVLIVNVTFKSLLWGFLHNFISMGSSKWWLLRTVDWHSRDHHCAGCFWSTFPHGQGSNRTKPASQNGFNQGEVTSMNSFMLSAYDNPRPSIHLVSLSSHLAAETKLMQLNLNRYTGVSLQECMMQLQESQKGIQPTESWLQALDTHLFTVIKEKNASVPQADCKTSSALLQFLYYIVFGIKFRFKQYYFQSE